MAKIKSLLHVVGSHINESIKTASRERPMFKSAQVVSMMRCYGVSKCVF